MTIELNIDKRLDVGYFVLYLNNCARAFGVSLSRILYSITFTGLYHRTTVRGHGYSGKPFECEVCQACFARSDSLARHMYSHSDKKTPFQCKLCPASFFRPSRLQIHSRIHTVEKSIKSDICKKKNSTWKQTWLGIERYTMSSSHLSANCMVAKALLSKIWNVM